MCDCDPFLQAPTVPRFVSSSAPTKPSGFKTLSRNIKNPRIFRYGVLLDDQRCLAGLQPFLENFGNMPPG